MTLGDVGRPAHDFEGVLAIENVTDVQTIGVRVVCTFSDLGDYNTLYGTSRIVDFFDLDAGRREKPA